MSELMVPSPLLPNTNECEPLKRGINDANEAHSTSSRPSIGLRPIDEFRTEN